MRNAFMGWRNPIRNSSSKPIHASQSWTKRRRNRSPWRPRRHLADARRDPDRHEDQPEQDHEVPEATRMEAEAVHEHLVVDGGALVAELVRGVERAVPGQSDLNHDHGGEQHRPGPVRSPHVCLPRWLTARAYDTLRTNSRPGVTLERGTSRPLTGCDGSVAATGTAAAHVRALGQLFLVGDLEGVAAAARRRRRSGCRS